MTNETYRGVRIRTQKGREWGYTAVRINGHDTGDSMETNVERVLSVVRANIDFALDTPDGRERMEGYWFPDHKGVRDSSCWQNHRCA